MANLAFTVFTMAAFLLTVSYNLEEDSASAGRPSTSLEHLFQDAYTYYGLTVPIGTLGCHSEQNVWQ